MGAVGTPSLNSPGLFLRIFQLFIFIFAIVKVIVNIKNINVILAHLYCSGFNVCFTWFELFILPFMKDSLCRYLFQYILGKFEIIRIWSGSIHSEYLQIYDCII